MTFPEKMTLADTPNEFKLDYSPNDLISSVRFSPSSNQLLLVSSWDCTLRLYDVTLKGIRTKYNHQGPIMDCCFEDAIHAWCGTLDCQVRKYDLNSNSETLIGNHDDAVRCIEHCPDVNISITGSWDATVKCWDARTNHCVGTFNQPDKVYTMAVCGEKLIVGTANRRVAILDLRNFGYLQHRESSLKYQTRCIRAFPNKQGYVLSSIEGRIAVEYLDPNPEAQKKKYAFKCHRIKENNGIEYIYPVNTIAFHNIYNTFATGGSDGNVNIWDGFNKKKLCQFHSYPTHISSLAFSPDGNTLAIASSFIYEANVTDIPPSSIYIRTVTDRETKPK